MQDTKYAMHQGQGTCREDWRIHHWKWMWLAHAHKLRKSLGKKELRDRSNILVTQLLFWHHRSSSVIRFGLDLGPET
jgi:hypothetical protein